MNQEMEFKNIVAQYSKVKPEEMTGEMRFREDHFHESQGNRKHSSGCQRKSLRTMRNYENADEY